MKIYIYCIVFVFVSCDISHLFLGNTKNAENFAITSVKFYKNTNVNMQDPSLYPDVDFIEAKMVGNQILARFKYQVFRKDGKRVLSINPTIKHNGDSLSPGEIEAITETRTQYTLKKGNKTKIYEIVIIVTEDSIPISLELTYDGSPLQYIDTNVWGYVGLPWDIDGLRGGLKPVTMSWEGDVEFLATELAIPSKTKFSKNGQDYTLELRLEKVDIEYPVVAKQDGKQVLYQNNDIYILPTKNASTLEIAFVASAVIDDIDDGEFDSHLIREENKNKISFTKNSAFSLNYNQERQVGQFSTTIDSIKRTHKIILRKYAGDTITFRTESGHVIFPKENYAEVSFQKAEENGARYIPSGRKIITIETAGNFIITIDNNDGTQYKEGEEKRMWQKIDGAANHNYTMLANWQQYTKTLLSNTYESYVTKQNDSTYLVTVSDINDKSTKIMNITYTYTDIMEYKQKQFDKDDANTIDITKRGWHQCHYSNYDNDCFWPANKWRRKIPNAGIVQRKLGLSEYTRAKDDFIISDYSYTFGRTVEMIIYYKKP